MKCKECTKVDMAQIPYVEHRMRMYRAYERERRLKVTLIATNALWVFGVAFFAIVR